MTETLIIRASEDLTGKSFTIGNGTGPLYVVIFFTWAGPSQLGEGSYALMRGLKEGWSHVSLPRKPDPTWSNSDWGAMALEMVTKHSAHYDGDRPSRFERDDVI